MTSAPPAAPVAWPAAPAGWANLDYPERRILIQATTKWERTFRAGACQKEPWTVAWLESMVPGRDVLWNVGANVGSYALIAGIRGIPTVAIEPGFASYAALANNILANRLETLVTPLCLAVGQGVGIQPLAYRNTESGAASHTFGQTDAPKTVGTLPTLTASLDDLWRIGLPAPTHILIDVDGTEPDVLAGGPCLLSEYGPSIMIEVQSGQEQPIAEILGSWGYSERERYEHRAGQLMQGCYYALSEREG